jgi:hypothetical protein
MAAWWDGSMKSGPTLKGWTFKPRFRSAAMRPRVTVVLPTPLWVPAMSTAGIFDNLSDGLIKSPSSGKDINTLEDVFRHAGWRN